ncbi:methylated-DNA--[protein]-cysteine S-methyltransferase [Planctomycetota bacterium]
MKKYVIFKTKWGHFTMAGDDLGLCRTILPVENPDISKSLLLRDFPQVRFDRNLFENLQIQIADYFEGTREIFSPDIRLNLDGLSVFNRKVLTTCRQIKFGQILSYSQLSEKIGSPNSGRAVGNALAKNTLPLIIPCHRVIRSDGKLGGFTGPGGTVLKKRLLQHEKGC